MPPLPGGRDGEKYLRATPDDIEPHNIFRIWHGSKKFSSGEWLCMHEQLVVFEVQSTATMEDKEASLTKAVGRFSLRCLRELAGKA